MSAYTASTFPVSDAGSKWFFDNFITTGRVNTLTNMEVAAEDPLSVRIGTATASGKLVIGDPTTAQQAVQAYKLWMGLVGASNPSDPISASINSLVDKATTATGSTSVAASTDKAKEAVGNISTKTGLPPWMIWIGIFVILYFLIRWIWRKIKRRRRR